MRIVIVGAGAVGSYLATRLSQEGQDVVVIEENRERAAELQDEIDALVLWGNGASPDILKQAGIENAELLIAVSNSDGANVLACHVGAEMGVKRTVARVEQPDMRKALSGLEVDFVIDPGEVAAHELIKLVEQGGVSELVEFAAGELILIGATVPPVSRILGRPLNRLRREIDGWDWIVAALIRHGSTIFPHGDTTIEAGDHILVMVPDDHVGEVTGLIGVRHIPTSRVVILGSTRLAELTARQMLNAGFEVVVIDRDLKKCTSLAEQLHRALVLCDDPTDPATLRDLNLDERDAVLALTGWDEVNILGCLLAKSLGAGITVARFNRIEYVTLLDGVGIDATVSSRLIAAGEILRFVRKGRVHTVAAFGDTNTEAIEVEVDKRSHAVGSSIGDLGLPRDALIGGILRRGSGFVPSGSTKVLPGDRIIFFASPESIPKVEKLFASA